MTRGPPLNAARVVVARMRRRATSARLTRRARCIWQQRSMSERRPVDVSAGGGLAQSFDERVTWRGRGGGGGGETGASHQTIRLFAHVRACGLLARRFAPPMYYGPPPDRIARPRRASRTVAEDGRRRRALRLMSSSTRAAPKRPAEGGAPAWRKVRLRRRALPPPRFRCINKFV